MLKRSFQVLRRLVQSRSSSCRTPITGIFLEYSHYYQILRGKMQRIIFYYVFKKKTIIECRCGSETPERLENQILTDPHSPRLDLFILMI